MRIQDLTREELELLNTDFGPELEKNAAAYVEEEMDKVAELEQVADDCYNYGAELAMQKIASMEAAHQEKVAMEEEKEGKKGLSKEKKESPEEEAMEEAEKTAAAMGNFTLEGYWDTLMEKGAEYYGDENIYLEELVKEAGYEKVVKSVKNFGKSMGRKVKKNNIFSGSSMGAREAKKTKDNLMNYAKKKGISMDSPFLNKSMKGVSKKSLGKGKSLAMRNRVIGGGMGVAGAAGAAGYYSGRE